MPRTDSFALKLLFVCSRNRMRSLTAEKLFEGRPGIAVRSAGTQPDARIIVTEGHIRWADIVFAMERGHVNRMRQKFADAVDAARVVVLNLPDEFAFMQQELIDALEAAVALELEQQPPAE